MLWPGCSGHGSNWKPKSSFFATSSMCGAADRRSMAASNVDRLVFVGLYRLAPTVLDVVKILQPKTLIRWHRAGSKPRRFKSRRRGDRRKIPADIRRLILEVSIANALWGAPGIHGELLKLEIDIGKPRLQIIWRREDGPVARLEDLSSQSRRRNRHNRHVRGPDRTHPHLTRCCRHG